MMRYGPSRSGRSLEYSSATRRLVGEVDSGRLSIEKDSTGAKVCLNRTRLFLFAF